MQRHFRRSVVALAVLLIGCGGPSDLAEDIGCGLLGCVPSSTLATSELAPDYVVETSGTTVHVQASFRSGGGIVYDVQLDTDRLVVETDASPPRAMQDELLRASWIAVYATVSPERRYTISLLRADGSRLASTVTLAPPFALLSPTQTLVLDRRSAPVAITVSAPATERLVSRVDGTCGSSQFFGGYHFDAPVAAAGGSSYLLDPAQLYFSIPPQALGETTDCGIELTLSRETEGRLADAFRPDGTFVGRHEKTLNIRFDAR